MLHKSLKVVKRIMWIPVRSYDTMSPSEYVSNYTNALLARNWQRKKLKPMIEASMTDSHA